MTRAAGDRPSCTMASLTRWTPTSFQRTGARSQLRSSSAKPEGQELIRRLAAASDILIENYKFRGLKKIGLDYESLKYVNPRLIYCSITGFGQTGL